MANPCKEKPDEISLSVFFPGAQGPVYASWYTGRLIVPLGKRTQYVHMGYESEYEKYMVFVVEAGRILSREVTAERPK